MGDSHFGIAGYHRDRFGHQGDLFKQEAGIGCFDLETTLKGDVSAGKIDLGVAGVDVHLVGSDKVAPPLDGGVGCGQVDPACCFQAPNNIDHGVFRLQCEPFALPMRLIPVDLFVVLLFVDRWTATAIFPTSTI